MLSSGRRPIENLKSENVRFFAEKALNSLCILIHFRTERHQCKFCQFKLLHPKWDPYDRNAEKPSQNQMFQRKRNPRYNHPDYIQQQGYRPSAIPHIFSKWKEA